MTEGEILIWMERKVTKVTDELVYYLLRAGAEDLNVQLKKKEDCYQIIIDSNFNPERQKAISSLEEMLLKTSRNRGMEEQYWELIGMNGNSYDPQLQLVGMLIDRAQVRLGEQTIHIELERMF